MEFSKPGKSERFILPFITTLSFSVPSFFLSFFTVALRGVSMMFVVASFSMSASADLAPVNKIYSFDTQSMGTRFHLAVAAPDQQQAKQLFKGSVQLLEELERRWSPWIEGSDVWKINHAKDRRITVSESSFRLLQRAEQISKLTEGAFDVTFASVGHMYRYREGVRPNEDERLSALPGVNYQYLELTSPNLLTVSEEGVRVDFGGIAKGESIDLLLAYLVAEGVTSAYFSLGGDSYVLGKKGDYPWMLGIKHPRKEQDVIARIPLENVAVSTSGDYERFFMDSGERVHHILSPQTGLPSQGVMSVTVIGPEAWKADALSTSVFVLGEKKGIALIETIHDYDVIIVDQLGRITASSGLVSR
jgi:thiamine biosynthesis lipoprotein